MIHVSSAPVEVGVFDVQESLVLAEEIRANKYPVELTQSSGRFVLNNNADVDTALTRLELIKISDFDDSESQQLRNRIYAQDFAEIDPVNFAGLPWHIDGSSTSIIDKEPFDFYFGSSNHPMQWFEGALDLSEAYRFVTNKYSADGFEVPNNPITLLLLAQEHSLQAISEAEQKGDGSVCTAVEGVLYRVERGTIHRMQPYDADVIYPARLCIEQYLIS